MNRTDARLRSGRSVWLPPSSSLKRRYRPLSGTHKTTVAIVGGGMTGALVAHAFVSAGISIAVVDAGLVGAGSTAASSALLLQEPDLELMQLEARYGRRTSRRIWALTHESVSELIALLRRLHIACSLRRRDSIYYTTDAEAAERLRRELALRTRAGFVADWLNPGAVRRVTGISARGAIRTRGSAQFDPYRACVGVLESAFARGAAILDRKSVV